MQVKKDTVKQQIVASAIHEFEKHGFGKASLRNIAKASGITVGNLYRYFKNKELLFNSITTQAFEEIREFIMHHHERLFLDKHIDLMQILHSQCQVAAQFIIARQAVLRVLIDGSEGTQYASAKQHLIIFMQNHMTDHVEAALGKKQALHYAVAIHMLSVGFMEGLFEIVRQKHSLQSMAKAIEQYILFYLQGFLQAFGITEPEKWLLQNKNKKG